MTAEKRVVRINALLNFFKGEEKLISKGENAYSSGHCIERMFDPDVGIVSGKVHASMRDRKYDVKVSFLFNSVIFKALIVKSC